jgi:hypothetical protein
MFSLRLGRCQHPSRRANYIVFSQTIAVAIEHGVIAAYEASSSFNDPSKVQGREPPA